MKLFGYVFTEFRFVFTKWNLKSFFRKGNVGFSFIKLIYAILVPLAIALFLIIINVKDLNDLKAVGSAFGINVITVYLALFLIDVLYRKLNHELQENISNENNRIEEIHNLLKEYSYTNKMLRTLHIFHPTDEKEKAEHQLRIDTIEKRHSELIQKMEEIS